MCNNVVYDEGRILNLVEMVGISSIEIILRLCGKLNKFYLNLF